MVKKLISKLKSINKSVLKTIKFVLKISLYISTISTLILAMYIVNPISSVTYLLGLSLLKSSFFFAVAGIICGVSMDYIMNLYKI